MAITAHLTWNNTLVSYYAYSKQPILGLTQPIFGLKQEWLRGVSLSRLECGVHDKLHISSEDQWWDPNIIMCLVRGSNPDWPRDKRTCQHYHASLVYDSSFMSSYNKTSWIPGFARDPLSRYLSPSLSRPSLPSLLFVPAFYPPSL